MKVHFAEPSAKSRAVDQRALDFTAARRERPFVRIAGRTGEVEPESMARHRHPRRRHVHVLPEGRDQGRRHDRRRFLRNPERNLGWFRYRATALEKTGRDHQTAGRPRRFGQARRRGGRSLWQGSGDDHDPLSVRRSGRFHARGRRCANPISIRAADRASGINTPRRRNSTMAGRPRRSRRSVYPASSSKPSYRRSSTRRSTRRMPWKTTAS